MIIDHSSYQIVMLLGAVAAAISAVMLASVSIMNADYTKEMTLSYKKKSFSVMVVGIVVSSIGYAWS